MLGKTVSHYEIVEKLGEGGMGEVYKARDTLLRRTVAIKVLPPAHSKDPTQRSRLLREARSASALNHAGIVTIHDILTEGDRDCLVMELVEGEPLGRRIPEGGLAATTVVKYATQIANALAAAHAAGIVHRDLKPDNVMITANDEIKVLDFGLAKFDDLAADDTEFALTQEGTVLGTLAYMSPEQALGKPADPRSDVFSFGVMLYEMLTGRRPFMGNSAPALMHAVAYENPQPLGNLRPELPTPWGAVLSKALAKDPDDRFQAMAAMAAAFEAAAKDVDLESKTMLADLEAPARKARSLVLAGRPKLQWLVRAVGAVVFLSLVVLAVLYIRGQDSPAFVEARPSVAVIGFKNLGSPDADWLATALSELLSTELASGGELRLIAGESVARMRQELSLTETESFAKDTLRRIGKNLGTQYVVVGSYLLMPGEEGGQLTVQPLLQNTERGETQEALRELGSDEDLLDLVSRVGARLRRELGASGLSGAEAAALQAASSDSPEATRLYALGIVRLRAFDPVSAKGFLEQAVEIDPGYAFAHAALSEAWSTLGYDQRASESAEAALALAEGLPRRELLKIQALRSEKASDWEQAIATYRVLWGYHPDDIEFGLRLAQAEISAGRPDQALRTLTTLQALPEPMRSDARIDLKEAAAAERRSDYTRAVGAAGRAVLKGRAQGAPSLEARALRRQAWGLIQLGQIQEARVGLVEARKLAIEANDLATQAFVSSTTASLYLRLGELARARDMYSDALEIERTTGRRRRISSVLNSLAIVTQKLGNLEEADTLLAEALAVADEIGNQFYRASALNNRASGLIQLGRLTAAETAARESLELSEELGTANLRAWNHYELGETELWRGRPADARRMFERAQEFSDRMKSQHLAGFVALGQARLLLSEGRLVEAGEALDRSRAARLDLDELGELAVTDLRRAELLLALDQPVEAEQLARRSAATFGSQGRVDDEALAWSLVAGCLEEQGARGEAGQSLQQALPRARETQNPAVRMMIGLSRARLADPAGNAVLRDLAAVASEAESLGFAGIRLEAELTLAQAELDAGRLESGRSRLRSVAASATEMGLGLLAERASAASGASGGRATGSG